MTIVTWSDSYSVKIPMIDAQHKKLFDLINALHDAMVQGKGMEVLGTTLDGLSKYTVVHFSEEEQMLAKVNYADLAAHKREHAVFIQKVSDLQSQYSKGNVALTMPVMEFLKDWLVNHIQKVDKKYMGIIK